MNATFFYNISDEYCMVLFSFYCINQTIEILSIRNLMNLVNFDIFMELFLMGIVSIRPKEQFEKLHDIPASKTALKITRYVLHLKRMDRFQSLF